MSYLFRLLLASVMLLYSVALSAAEESIISPKSLIGLLQNDVLAGSATDSTWITEQNLNLVFVHDLYLYGALRDYAIVKELASSNYSSSPQQLANNKLEIDKYYNLYVDIGKGQKLQVDAFSESLKDMAGDLGVDAAVKTLDILSNKYLGERVGDDIPSFSWETYSNLKNISDLVKLMGDNDLEKVKAVWNVLEMAGEKFGFIGNSRGTHQM